MDRDDFSVKILIITLVVMINKSSDVECHRIMAHRKISCLSCHKFSPPYYGCLDMDDVTLEEIKEDGFGPDTPLWRRGMDVVDKCVTCAIEDTWDLESKTLMNERKRLCFVSNLTTSGCTYDYTLEGLSVIETCYCDQSLCNLNDITSLGGLKDITKFPKKQVGRVEAKSTGNNMGSLGCGVDWILTLIPVYFRLAV